MGMYRCSNGVIPFCLERIGNGGRAGKEISSRFVFSLILKQVRTPDFALGVYFRDGGRGGFWLLVPGYWWLVAGYWWLVAGYWLLVAGYWWLVVGFRYVRTPHFALQTYFRRFRSRYLRLGLYLHHWHLLNLIYNNYFLLDFGLTGFKSMHKIIYLLDLFTHYLYIDLMKLFRLFFQSFNMVIEDSSVLCDLFQKCLIVHLCKVLLCYELILYKDGKSKHFVPE
ncbi:MAG: hypothetical protein DRI97_01155 [Bacteroidetes bacterium]|nr:MAG: hypothetical protein DRI83_10355 [Bacteroidota bacterium]RLD59383.1 MAG: hypothetical protein DRI97_01155 [Bacteroidota bacterium]RLD82175.1 MAG: hypothetical protein DRJ15_02275 [Bacteroidota bacterium]